MYPEAAYWILGSIMMVTATLIGFILIAAVFYIERSKALFDSTRKLTYSILDFVGGSHKITEDFRLVKATAWSASKKGFAKFISLLLISSIIGIITILYAVHVISTVPGSSEPLADTDVARVYAVVILFAVFLAAAILTVVLWLASGFIMATILTAEYESVEHALRLLSEFDKRLEPRLRTILGDMIQLEETRLGRKLSKEELSTLIAAADDKDSELARRITDVMKEEKDKILSIVGRSPKGSRP